MPIFRHGKNTRILLADPYVAPYSFTGNAINGSSIILVPMATAVITPGSIITTASGLAANTYVVSIVGNNVTLSSAFTGSTGAVTFTITPGYGLTYDVSQYFNDVGTTMATEAAETTTFQFDGFKSYIPGLREGSISLSGLYDGTVQGVDAFLQTALNDANDESIVVFPEGGTAENSRCYMAQGVTSKYDLKSPVSGVVAADSEIQCDGGLWSGTGKFFSATSASSVTTVAYQRNPAAANNTQTTSKGGLLIVGVTNLQTTGTSPSFSWTFRNSADNSTYTTLSSQSAIPTSGVWVVPIVGSIYQYTQFSITLASSTGTSSANVYYGFARY